MASGAPVSRLVLRATSVAEDLGYVALADLSRALGPDVGTNYRVIGGHMVSVLAARWDLGSELYRETGDADLGLPPVVIKDHHIVERLMEIGYEPVAGNSFARLVSDIPVQVSGEAGSPRQAVIDVLVPAYTSRARQNRRITDTLVTTEVLGLATALKRAPVTLTLELHRLNGERLDVKLSFPDEVAALVLKSFATRARTKATDVVDVWRCLEIALAAGVEPRAFTDARAIEAAEIVRGLFHAREGGGMMALIDQQRLSASAADERFTRLRALIARVLGTN